MPVIQFLLNPDFYIDWDEKKPGSIFHPRSLGINSNSVQIAALNQPGHRSFHLDVPVVYLAVL
jgi:hypothetical protein